MKILFRAIKTKHKNWTVIADEVKVVIDKEVKPDLLEYFERIVKSWKHRPNFKAMKRVRGGGISIYVYPTGENAKIWNFVSRGTKKHTIKPRKPGGKLAFPWGGYGSYKPKTSKGGHYGGPGTVANPKTTVLPVVEHPGSEGRNFEEIISKWYRSKHANTIRAAIRRGAR